MKSIMTEVRHSMNWEKMATGLLLAAKLWQVSSNNVSHAEGLISKQIHKNGQSTSESWWPPHHHFHSMAWLALLQTLFHKAGNNAFINALRYFTAIKGPVREIRSDQRTNFVGAKNELMKAIKEEWLAIYQRRSVILLWLYLILAIWGEYGNSRTGQCVLWTMSYQRLH